MTRTDPTGLREEEGAGYAEPEGFEPPEGSDAGEGSGDNPGGGKGGGGSKGPQTVETPKIDVPSPQDGNKNRIRNWKDLGDGKWEALPGAILRDLIEGTGRTWEDSGKQSLYQQIKAGTTVQFLSGQFNFEVHG